MKFGQLIEYNKRNIFFKNHKIMQKMRQGDLFQTSFFKKKSSFKVKESGLRLGFTIFRQASNQYTIETNFTKLQTIDPEINSISIFQKRGWGQFLHQILCMIFKEKCLSCYILLPDQISLSDCHYFLKYWAICELELFVNQVVTS